MGHNSITNKVSPFERNSELAASQFNLEMTLSVLYIVRLPPLNLIAEWIKGDYSFKIQPWNALLIEKIYRKYNSFSEPRDEFPELMLYFRAEIHQEYPHSVKFGLDIHLDKNFPPKLKAKISKISHFTKKNKH